MLLAFFLIDKLTLEILEQVRKLPKEATHLHSQLQARLFAVPLVQKLQPQERMPGSKLMTS